MYFNKQKIVNNQLNTAVRFNCHNKTSNGGTCDNITVTFFYVLI